MGKSILYFVCCFIVPPQLLPAQAMATPIRDGAIQVGIAEPAQRGFVQVRNLAGVRVALSGSSVSGMFAGFVRAPKACHLPHKTDLFKQLRS